MCLSLYNCTLSAFVMLEGKDFQDFFCIIITIKKKSYALLFKLKSCHPLFPLVIQEETVSNSHVQYTLFFLNQRASRAVDAWQSFESIHISLLAICSDNLLWLGWPVCPFVYKWPQRETVPVLTHRLAEGAPYIHKDKMHKGLSRALA